LSEIIKNYFKDISVGMNSTYEKQITSADVTAFAGISGDYNPLHIDDEFAKNSIFGERIAHGMLTASHISAALNTLAGPGWIYVSQSLYFRAPVKIGDVLKTTVKVKKCISKKMLVEFSTDIKVADKLVLTGTATAKSPD
jgi:3-hydroxybutyryl-CoA dehydratase